MTETNFAFLAAYGDAFSLEAGRAESDFARGDAANCLRRLRVLGESLAKYVATELRLLEDGCERFVDIIRRLFERGAINQKVKTLFHQLRMAGNEATHVIDSPGTEALHQLSVLTS